MLEARSLQTSCQQACAPAQGCRKESFLLSSELPMIPSNPRYALGCRRITLTFASTFAWFLLTFFLCVIICFLLLWWKHWTKATCEKRVCLAYRLQPRKGFARLIGYSPPPREAGVGVQGGNWSRGPGGTLLIGLLPLVCPATFLYNTGPLAQK